MWRPDPQTPERTRTKRMTRLKTRRRRFALALALCVVTLFVSAPQKQAECQQVQKSASDTQPNSSSFTSTTAATTTTTTTTQSSPLQRRAITTTSSSNVCKVNDGESVAILQIEESRGSEMGQSTSPSELPIGGNVESGEMELKIESETHKYFRLQNKSLVLVRPLDRDAQVKENSTQIIQQAISSIYLQISCVDKRNSTASARARKVIIPVLVKVLDLNDQAPRFTAPVYQVQVNELAPVGTIILDQLVYAIDLDSSNNGQVEYSLAGAPAPMMTTTAAVTTTTTAASWPQTTRVIGASQRLIQRAPQVVTSTSTTTTTPASEQTSTTTSITTAPTTTTSATSEVTSEPTASNAETSEFLSTTPATTTTTSSSRSSTPTINLNSEPIINGPMEEMDEDESDEALLAAMNAANSTDSEGELEAPGDLAAASLMLSEVASRVRPLRTRLLSNIEGESEEPEERRRRRRKRRRSRRSTAISSPPWTNLMSSEDFKALELTSGDSAAPTSDEDAHEFFALELAPISGRPVIKLKRALDYETRRVHRLTLIATDRAANRNERHSSRATIIVRVLDGDDQPPAFVLDQVGCATGSLPQSTTPLPVIESKPASEDEPARRPVPTSIPTGPATSSQQLRSFRVTEENFDFGDTLALDDSPLDVSTGSIDSSVARVSRRVHSTPAQPIAKTRQDQMTDYLCLAAGAQQQQQRNAEQLAEYYATVVSGDSDYLLRLAPQSIKARDRDELNAPIRYGFLNGTPANYSHYFHINPLDASIKQVAPVERAQVSEFVLFVRAEEQTYSKLFSLAKLTIEVLASDKNPPVLMPNSYSGQVDENSPLGARVSTASNESLRIQVVDLGASSSRPHEYDFETTSDAFKVDRDGFVYVAKFPLDRDAPASAVHMFQVTARQVGLQSASSKSVSSPVSLNITLLDLNDNPPQLQNSSLAPLQMVANSRGGANFLHQVLSSDRDWPTGSDATIKDHHHHQFALVHVSNSGASRFRMDADSGRIESLGKFAAGESFSLTIQVSDELGRSAQGILDVQVVPGANSAGPQFLVEGQERDNSRGYSVEINEALAVGSLVLQVRAHDPDNDPISYSLIDGNSQQDFAINSKTGALTLAHKLDREEISAYRLIVQARDSGGLATSRPVQISVSDANDQNPVFTQSHYVFAVDEGPSSVGGAPLGRVLAHDGDEGENGRVSYSLMSLAGGGGGDSGEDAEVKFAINEQTGDIRLLEPLDYERARSHTLLVVARDAGETPRSSSASVLIRVLDRQDEAPYFERALMEARLDENQANARVALVEARDPDSVAQVSYTLLAGDSTLFQVDSQTGVVSTSAKGLDFEVARMHTLLIGTNESARSSGLQLDEAQRLSDAIASAPSTTANRWPVVRLDVHVNDLNDEPPQFEPAHPLPVRVQDSVALGSQLATSHLRAHDRDGSAPNNQLRYELVTGSGSDAIATSDKCAELFMVDATTGAISVRADLRRDSLSECQLVVRARDLPARGDSLSSTCVLTVFIDHLAEISPASMIQFADSQYFVELAENAPPRSLVKLLPVINKPKLSFPMSCELVSGNELNKFELLESDARDCELRTRADAQIDYEHKRSFTLMVKLNTIGTSSRVGGGGGTSAGSSAASSGTLAQVQVNIVDRNDNRPQFGVPARYAHLTGGRFLAALASDSAPESQVLQVRATDLDSAQANGLISYELLNDQELEGRFKVDSMDGIVRTARPIEDLPPTRLPVRLKVLARDNPEQTSESLESQAEIVVNLLDDRTRLVLVLKDTQAARALDLRDELLAVLQERTGLIAGLERVESLKIQRNSSAQVEADLTGSDLWFHLVEPGTLRLVPSDDARLRAVLLEPRAQSSLADIVAHQLGLARARVRLPYALTTTSGVGASTSAQSPLLFGTFRADSSDRLAPVLILVALFIALASAVVVVYQCGSVAGWSSAESSAAAVVMQQQQQQQQRDHHHHHFAKDKFLFAAPPPPHEQRASYASSHEQEVYSAAVAAAKEYETQMLKMSVLFDDSQSFDEQQRGHDAILAKNLL